LELAILKAEEDEDLKTRLERAYNQLERMADIVRSLSRITRYRTKQYVEGVDILDLDPPTNF
jgi:phosphoglycerate-specific signal transduction histidine kinase